MIFLLILLFVGVLANYSSIRAQFRTLRKETGNTFWLWVLFFIAIVNFGKVESESIIVSNLFQLAAIAVAVLCVLSLLLIRFNRILSKMSIPICFLMIYACTGIMSGTYSPFPAFSVYKASLILLSLFALLVSMSYGSRDGSAKGLISINLLFFFAIVLSAIVGAIIDPARATEYRQGMVFGMLKGWLILVNANSLAVYAGVLSLFALSRFMGTPVIRQKLLYGSLFATNFATMLFAQSRTCVVAFIIALLVLFSRKRLKYLLVGLFIAVPLIGIYDATRLEKGMEKYFRRGQSEKQFRSWSGRLTAWDYSWERFKKAPILGYGMAAGVRFGSVDKGYIGSHLHSSYFETLLNSGLIGFIPWLIGLIAVLGGMLKYFLFPPRWFDAKTLAYHTEIAAVFVFFLIRAFAGTTFVYFDHIFMMYLAIIGYLVSIRAQPKPVPGGEAEVNGIIKVMGQNI